MKPSQVIVKDQVSLAKTMRPRIPRLTFVFLGLAICVFTWGLQYKVSLYYPEHSSHHQVPEAKLLSRNEQPGTVAKLHVVTAKELASSVMLACFAAITLCLLPERNYIPPRKKPWLAPRQASLDAFFFRPPPISA